MRSITAPTRLSTEAPSEPLAVQVESSLVGVQENISRFLTTDELELVSTFLQFLYECEKRFGSEQE